MLLAGGRRPSGPFNRGMLPAGLSSACFDTPVSKRIGTRDPLVEAAFHTLMDTLLLEEVVFHTSV